MKKLFLAAACVLALSVPGAAAGSKAKQPSQTPSGTTTGTAVDQKLYGGNPDAGGGPRGNAQATNNPKASNEIGSGR